MSLRVPLFLLARGAHACSCNQACYMHSVSKITSWQHPRDDYFKSLVLRNRERARFIEAVLRNNGMYVALFRHCNFVTS
jgi:hypothetical protein